MTEGTGTCGGATVPAAEAVEATAAVAVAGVGTQTENAGARTTTANGTTLNGSEATTRSVSQTEAGGRAAAVEEEARRAETEGGTEVAGTEAGDGATKGATMLEAGDGATLEDGDAGTGGTTGGTEIRGGGAAIPGEAAAGTTAGGTRRESESLDGSVSVSLGEAFCPWKYKIHTTARFEHYNLYCSSGNTGIVSILSTLLLVLVKLLLVSIPCFCSRRSD